MPGVKEKPEKKNHSTVATPPPSKEKQKNYQTLKTNDGSPPAPLSSYTHSKASLQTNDTSAPAPKAEAPKTSAPEQKKSPPPPNSPPKKTPKSSPPPSPPSQSKSPPSPPKKQSPPQKTPTIPTKQSPPKQEQSTTTTTTPTPTQQSPSQRSPSTPTQQSSPSSNPPDQQSPPSSTPTKKESPPSPSNPTKNESPPSQQNSPSDSKPDESSSDNNLSPPPPPSTDASQSAPPTTYSESALTSTQTSITASTGIMTPDFPPETSVNIPKPLPAVIPPNAVGESSKNNDSRSSNDAENIIESDRPSYGFVIGATVVALLIIAFVLFLFFRDRRKKRQEDSIAKFMATPADISVRADAIKGHPPQKGQQSDMENSPENQNSSDIYVSKTSFSYEEVMEMTDGFARENMIGEGGFGCVYKGRTSDGKIVAVKQLKIGSGQGEREFRAEVEIISRVHHRHLVSLVGYCIANNQRLLIYEFVPNSTLERHLHGKDLPVLEWAKRVKIAEGAAKGLAYLHEDCHPRIIHRDIKSANILLDEEFEAQVADFGLARLNDTSNSHVSTRVMGTFGYLAPEYASSGKLTDRSDVYSFGVVILELITGRKPIDSTRPLGDENLVECARPLLIEALKTGNCGELIDPRLEKRYVESEVFTMMEAAAACVRHSATKRPRMALVARALDFNGDLDLSNGVKVGQSTAYDSAQYSEEITRFRMMELGCDNSSESDTYSDESISREFSGEQNSGMSRYSSGESTTGESGTQGSKPSPSGR